MMASIPTKKLKSGFELPVYGLGMWQMGGRNEADPSNDEKDIKSIRLALDSGITHIDTAESYGDGHSEELLGRAIEGYARKKLIIATKVSAWNQSYSGVMRAFENSLKRLGTDYVDLYLLHRYPQPGTDIKDTMKAMDELVEQGLVKNIGACNMTPRRFDEAQRHSSNKLVCNQVHYNVQYREIEHYGIPEHCRDNDIMLVAWRPVQKGILPQAKLIDELAEKYGKTPMQIAINWLVSQTNVVAISKTGSAKHLKENLGAVGWAMEDADIERIREEFPDQKEISDAVPLDYAADMEP